MNCGRKMASSTELLNFCNKGKTNIRVTVTEKKDRNTLKVAEIL